VAFILAIDQGTTSSRALVVDERGAIRGLAQFPFEQHFPRPGWVEHDAEEIWETTQAAIAAALRAASAAIRDIAAIGITNQRETVVLWDRLTGSPVQNAIVWQDRRTASLCGELQRDGHERLVQERTGLTIDPYFSGTKLAWLLQDPMIGRRARAGELEAGTIDSWLTWKLTNGHHVTDYSNASRTMLFDIHGARWDADLCGLLGVPEKLLPEALPSSSHFGQSSDEVLGTSIPIMASIGDQQSALFGQACTHPGLAKNTYGTGCFVLANRGSDARPSQNRLLTSLTASARPGKLDYMLEGSVFVAGSLVQWLRDGLGIIERSEDVEALALSVESSEGVTIVPAFAGLGAPYWDPAARGQISGLTRGMGRGHIARAALEAIALSSAELITAMEADLGAPVAELRVDGGASRNNTLMQMQADFSGIPVVRPQETETTALGAAYLAGIGAGIWANEEEIASLWRADRRFEPAMGAAERTERMAAWRRAVSRTLEGAPS
jgi:glycerol kinase